MISTAHLSNNEIVGLSVIEITSIPDTSIISNEPTLNEVLVTNNKKSFILLLTEVYQQYKSLNLSTRINNDISIELLWVTKPVLNQPYRANHIWSSGHIQNAFYRLPYIITAEEASEFLRLPFGNEYISAGLNVNKSDKSSKKYFKDIINSGDIEIGKLKSSSKGDSIGISLKDLAKHMLVVRTPCPGKTTFSVSLLDRLWKEHNIPFLVIEPAKNEYLALIQSIPDLQVFTPGKNFIFPIVFIPFVPPKNVKLESYKSTLKTAFEFAVSMSSPLEKIFEESINNCYSDFHWLDTYTSDNMGKVFNIGYTGDARNIGRAGVARATKPRGGVARC